MSSKVVQINSFCGGTSRLVDDTFLGNEQSINMFPETVEATESYTKKILKSLESLTESDVNTYSSIGYVVGLKRVSNLRATASYDGSAVIVVGTERVYAIYRRVDDRMGYVEIPINSSCSSIWESLKTKPAPAAFAETSGANPYLLFTRAGKLFYIDLTNPSVKKMNEPTSFVTNAAVSITSLAYLNYRVIIGESNSDYIYWSELNKPNGEDDEHAFEQKLTCYAFTKTDGTVVSFSDQQYYAPAYGTYDTSTLQTQTNWYGALNNVKVDFRGDNVVKIAGLDNCFVALGTRSMQAFKWQNNANIPFISNEKTTAVGCFSGYSVAVGRNSVIFVGESSGGNFGVYTYDGSQVAKISNASVERRLKSVKYLGDNFYGFFYSRNGHEFYVLSYFADGSRFTVVYDFTEGVWHDRANLKDGELEPWGPIGAETMGNQTYFFYRNIDSRSKQVFMFDDGLNGYAFKEMVKERTTGIKFDGYNDVIVRSLELVINSGEFQTFGEPPRLMLQVSYDGGYTWSTEMWNNAGRMGKYNWRVIWRNLGKGPKVAFRVRMTDNAPLEIATAILEYSPCGNRIG